jgi:hypothetical protein
MVLFAPGWAGFGQVGYRRRRARRAEKSLIAVLGDQADLTGLIVGGVRSCRSETIGRWGVAFVKFETCLMLLEQVLYRTAVEFEDLFPQIVDQFEHCDGLLRRPCSWNSDIYWAQMAGDERDFRL